MQEMVPWVRQIAQYLDAQHNRHERVTLHNIVAVDEQKRTGTNTRKKLTDEQVRQHVRLRQFGENILREAWTDT